MKTQRVLLVVDGSPEARHAIDVAVEVALRSAARVCVLALKRSESLSNFTGWDAPALAGYAAERLRRAEIEVELLPAVRLHDAVESFGTDLIVVTADHAQYGPALKLVRQTDLPLLVVGPSASPRPIGNSVVVGVMDGTDIIGAVDGVAEFARSLGARVTVVHARRIAPRVSTSDFEHELVEQAVMRLRAEGVNAGGRVLPQTADTAGAINRAASAEGAGLIVFNSRRLGGLRAWLTGNVAGNLVRKSGRPILLPAKHVA